MSISDSLVIVTTIILGVAAFSFASASEANAAERSRWHARLNQEVPVACKDIDLRNAEPGVKCSTSKGVVYERVSRDHFGEAWKGPEGLIWSDKIGTDTQYNAVEKCKILGGTLPSRADYLRGGANGFGEVLPNGNSFSWSSSVPQNKPEYAYVYSGTYDGGDDEMDFYFVRTYNLAFRCIGR